MENTSAFVLPRIAPRAYADSERVLDLVTGSYLLLLLLIVALFPFRFHDSTVLAERMLIVLTAFTGMALVSQRIRAGGWHAAARIGLYASVLMYLFDEMQYFQNLLYDRWFDADVLRLEQAVMGGNAVALIQPTIHPWLTEGLMFAYVLYMPLLPVLAWVMYRAGSEPALSDYLLNLASIFLVCFTGYILLPAASPMYYNPGEYVVPLNGGLWTWCGEWLRQNHHYPGGSIPSAHCAAATGMLLMLYRHYRKGFYVGLPIYISICVATVYCRYHYLTDSVLGVITGLAVVSVTPHAMAILRIYSLQRPGFDLKTRKSRTPEAYTILTHERPAGDSLPF